MFFLQIVRLKVTYVKHDLLSDAFLEVQLFLLLGLLLVLMGLLVFLYAVKMLSNMLLVMVTLLFELCFESLLRLLDSRILNWIGVLNNPLVLVGSDVIRVEEVLAVPVHIGQVVVLSRLLFRPS